ncbi:MAG: sterol desaturase family protein, partial [Stellaceae bacterium]
WLGVVYNDAVLLLLTAPMFGVLSLPVPLTAAYLAYGFFVHANLRLDLGRLTPVIVGPQYHRIHHSLVPRHFHRNFAVVFPAIDMIFGTYYRPRPGEFPETGLEGVRHDSVWQLQLLPFRRARIPARSAAEAAN